MAAQAPNCSGTMRRAWVWLWLTLRQQCSATVSDNISYGRQCTLLFLGLAMEHMQHRTESKAAATYVVWSGVTLPVATPVQSSACSAKIYGSSCQHHSLGFPCS
jgi:hypothetical protein